ncbi:ABC-F family ATP-binding cassette domain-containing protein [Arthrobacter castelli]|uniref:ABC-F family ATP-binding cassette domain-containing protein n=1 Tax=Arthrobacter castelli TaxID=271431 RepID=UPI000418A637|nr:ABC-F family ATP-binding cassette domain-containing protein [Arthrobacter castelli]
MPASVALSRVCASFGARTLFSNLDLDLTPGDVVAVVGPNGAGKSTLMRMVSGDTAITEGAIRTAPPDAAVGYLPQSVPDGGESLLAYARRRTGIAAADVELDLAARALSRELPGSDERYSHALARWVALGAADLEERLPAVAARAGLDVDSARPLGTLSGGQAARAALVTVLLSQYDVLLLDEPSNNLDTAGLDLIEEFITSQQGPVMIASHDRRLLDVVATSVLELDLKQQRVGHYTGNYSDYAALRQLDRRHAHERYEQYARTRDELEAQARQRAQWAAKGSRAAAKSGEPDKHIKHRKGQRADAQAGRAARARKAVERLQPVAQPRKEWELQYSIAEAPAPAELVLGLSDAVVVKGGFRLGPVDVEVGRGERIALVGANGSGKTTLIDALAGDVPVQSGRRVVGTKVSTGHIDQERSLLSGSRPLADVVIDRVAAGGGPADDSVLQPAGVRTLLAKFGLGADHAGRTCDSLSMGEKTRALLAVLQARAVNLLVLDEPTNHLDVEAIEQLELALAAFDGTLLVVSHDRTLLEGIGITQWWQMEQFLRSEDKDIAP